MALLVGSLLFYLVQFPRAWRLVIGPLYIGYPFLDTHGILAAAEAHMLGWDLRTMASNPLDFLGRGNSTYPNIWYNGLGKLGFSTEHEIPFALATNGMFIAVCLFLLYPRSWSQVLIGFLAICSPGVLLAMERGNNDLIIFLLLAIVPLCFQFRQRFGSLLAWMVLLVCTVLKYYPIIAYIVFLKNTKTFRELFWYAAAAVFAVTAYLTIYIDEFLLVPHNLKAYSDPANLFTFGAKGIFHFANVGEDSLMTSALLGLLAVLLGSAYLAVHGPINLPQIANLKQNFFILGVAVSAFTFFTILSYDYRTIFLLFTIPYILDLAKSPTVGRSFQFAARILVVLLLTMMWVETVYFFVILDPVQHRWNVVGLRYILMFKHGLAWIVMSMMVGFVFLLLKPNVVRLWLSLKGQE